MVQNRYIFDQNNANYSPKWCHFITKTTIFIAEKGAYLWLKQHLINVFLQGIDGYLMDKTVLFISIIDVIYMLKQYYLLP